MSALVALVESSPTVAVTNFGVSFGISATTGDSTFVAVGVEVSSKLVCSSGMSSIEARPSSSRSSKDR